MATRYKHNIDKSLLSQFLQGNHSEETLNELFKVFKVVLIKHFPNHQNNKELYQVMYVYLEDRASSYNPFLCPYNYIYTISRNCLTNHFYHLNKIHSVPLDYDEPISFVDSESSIPDEILRYQSYLLGEEDFTVFRIPSKDALNLILFMDYNTDNRKIKVPFFINKSYLNTLYKLLKFYFYK